MYIYNLYYKSMDHILFISIALTILSIFLIIYAFTLPLFPDEWRKKVNSNKNSLNPKHNNESLTGALIIIVSAAACLFWGYYFYFYIFLA